MSNEGRRAALHTLGCKVNAYETEGMRQQLEKAGYEIVPFESEADVYVINTCSVTNLADRKSRQMLHRAKKRNPEAIIVAAGCYAQTALQKTHLDVDADILLGNNRKGELAEVLEEYRRENGTQSEGTVMTLVPDLSDEHGYETLSLSANEGHTRAFLKVQDGCNQFCSYCIIPYARGRVRSNDPEKVRREVEDLAKAGTKEIVLTGIHLSSYGVDNGSCLAELIELCAGVEGIERIRLGSLEPGIITPEFATRMKNVPELCPHFHLSLQSGSDTVLRRMNRHYSAQEYLDKCALLRETFDDPAITTDVIVGFPGETEEEFQETRAFLQKADLYETHIFRYSKREGTRAAAMENQIPENIKAVRSDILSQDDKERRSAYEKRHVGRNVSCLFEEQQEVNGKTCYVGHTKEYIRIAVPDAGEDLTNCLRRGIISEQEGCMTMTFSE